MAGIDKEKIYRICEILEKDPIDLSQLTLKDKVKGSLATNDKKLEPLLKQTVILGLFDLDMGAMVLFFADTNDSSEEIAKSFYSFLLENCAS
ncbi:MAG: hypothetical protein WC650_06140 [Candidatus Doudnabacteria bacterium]